MSLRLIIPLVYLRRLRGTAPTDDPEKIMPRPRSSRSPAAPSSLGLPLTYTRNTMDRALPGMVDEDAEATAAMSLPRYRFTPLIAGVLIPFSILLEIPGTTERWYVRTYGNDVVETRANPAILNAGLTLSLISAVFATLCLILRFLEWRMKLVTLLCIGFLSFHDIINTIAVTIFGVQHRFNDGFTYGQAFWITVCSTIVSTVTNISLIADFIRTSKFSESGSGLTRKQRSLIIVMISFLIYISFCSIVNVYVVAINRDFLEALYYTLVTIQTIGFGDIVPHNSGGRIWTCIYATFGIVFLGVVVGMLSETVLEALQAGYVRRVAEVRLRRRELIKRRKRKYRWRKAVETRLRAKGAPIWTGPQGQTSMHSPATTTLGSMFATLSGRNTAGAGRGSARAPLRLNVAALTPEELTAAAREAEMPQRAKHEERGRKLERGGDDRPTPERSDSADSANMVFSKSFEEYKDNLESEKTKQFFARVSLTCIAFLIFWIGGSLIFMKTEGWSFGVGMYFCYITFTTIGFGDYHVSTGPGRAVFVFWALLGVAAMTTLISVVVDAFSAKYKSVLSIRSLEKAIRKYRRRQLSISAVPSIAFSVSGLSGLGPYVSSPPGSETGLPPTGTVDDTASQHSRTAREALELLPTEILEQARELEERVKYFATLTQNKEDRDSSPARVPASLQRLMNDIAHAEGVPTSVRHEVFHEEEARQALFMLSVEEALHKMIGAAEQSLSMLAQRDRVRSRTGGRRSTASLSLAGPSESTATDRENIIARGRKSLISIVTDPAEERQVSMGPEPIPEEPHPINE